MIKLQELAGMAKEISSKKWFLNADEEVTAIDNDALPDDTEEAFIGCAANIQLAKYMAAANPETILAIAEAYSALEQRLKAAETEVQRLNATAQPVSDGWVKCSERMPNPEDARRVCAFTPSEHADLKLRLISSDLFKTVCRSATHWIYVDEPAAPGGQD